MRRPSDYAKTLKLKSIDIDNQGFVNIILDFWHSLPFSAIILSAVTRGEKLERTGLPFDYTAPV